MKNWIIIALVAAVAVCATLGVVAAASGQSGTTVIVAQATASGDMRLSSPRQAPIASTG